MDRSWRVEFLSFVLLLILFIGIIVPFYNIISQNSFDLNLNLEPLRDEGQKLYESEQKPHINQTIQDHNDIIDFNQTNHKITQTDCTREYIIKIQGNSVNIGEISQNLKLLDCNIINYYHEIGLLKIIIDSDCIPEIIAKIKKFSFVQYIEPNIYYATQFTPDDTYFNYQWALEKIGMQNAWNVNLGNRNVKVAVLDTGLDYTHPDLMNQYLAIGYDWVNGDNDPYDDSNDGHGTAITGIICATINNAIGIAGLANITVFSEKILGSNGIGETTNIVRGINHAIVNGADILCLSWGGYQKSLFLEEAINNAIENGSLVIASAGNDNTDKKFYPAALNGVVAVTATQQNDLLTQSTNYGEWVDISAPGDGIYTTSNGGGYSYKSGTSVAAPHVVGLAALIKSERGVYTSNQILSIIQATATDLGEQGWDQYYGWGQISAEKALAALYEKNVAIKVKVSSHVAVNHTAGIKITLYNTGLTDTYSVKTYTYINDSFSTMQLVPILKAGEFQVINQSFIPTSLDIFNISVFVLPIEDETYLVDNSENQFTKAVAQQLYPNDNELIEYGLKSDYYPFETQFQFKNDYLEPCWSLRVNGFDKEVFKTKIIRNTTINLFTREWTGKFDLFPYWINTSAFYIGKSVDIFILGSNDGMIINQTAFNYYGIIIPVWIINCSGTFLMYSNNTGILLNQPDYEDRELVYSSIFVAGGNLNNSRVRMLSNIYHVNHETNITIFLRNVGSHIDLIVSELVINNSIHLMQNNLLQGGEYVYYNFSLTPREVGYYNITVSIICSNFECVLRDNNDSQFYNIYELKNYSQYEIGFNWLNAETYGHQLPISMDGIQAVNLSLPFTFRYYGIETSSLWVDVNGRVSFNHQIIPSSQKINYPNDIHPLDLSVFGEELEAYLNVFIWNTSEFVVIEYNECYYSEEWVKAGTFEIVLYKNNSIKFQYLNIFEDMNTTTGLNYGYNVSYFTIIARSFSSTVNYSILLTDDEFQYHNIQNNLLIVNAPVTNEVNNITMNIKNIGNMNENNITLKLFINKTEYFYLTDIELPINKQIEVIFYWSPEIWGKYNFTSIVSLSMIDHNLDNNVLKVWEYVRGIKIKSPTNNMSVVGGQSIFEYEATNSTLIKKLIINSSSRVISLVKPTSNRVIVPIFDNGTQTIHFTVEWEDGVHAQDWIAINSLLVEKCIDVQIAEYMKWTIVNKTTGTITNYSYVVMCFIEDNIVNITFTKDSINNNKRISSQGWILLNLFNSYVEDSNDESWKDKHFYFLENISDNIVPAYNWNIILEYKSLDIWGDYQALSFVAGNNQAKFVYNRSVICIIFDWESPAITGELYLSNMIPPAELRKPLVFGPTDLELYETETSREIVWLVEDEHPSIYHLYRNGTIVDSKIWSNRSIRVVLDFLLLGVNNLTIHVFDKYNNSQVDTVFIKVLNVEDPPIVTLLSPIGGCTLEGIVDIRWKATDPDGDTLVFSLFVFNGEQWSLLEEGILNQQYSWDTTMIKNGRYILRIMASDGILIGIDELLDYLIIENPFDKELDYFGVCAIVIMLIIAIFSIIKKIT